MLRFGFHSSCNNPQTEIACEVRDTRRTSTVAASNTSAPG